MSKVCSNFSLYVAKSRVTGLGVFTSRIVKRGEIVETAPVLQLEKVADSLEDYVLSESRICLGYGALYNHSDEPNVRQKCDTVTCTFTALAEIAADDELFIDYGQEWWRARGRVPLKNAPQGESNAYVSRRHRL